MTLANPIRMNNIIAPITTTRLFPIVLIAKLPRRSQIIAPLVTTHDLATNLIMPHAKPLLLPLIGASLVAARLGLRSVLLAHPVAQAIAGAAFDFALGNLGPVGHAQSPYFGMSPAAVEFAPRGLGAVPDAQAILDALVVASPDPAPGISGEEFGIGELALGGAVFGTHAFLAQEASASLVAAGFEVGRVGLADSAAFHFFGAAFCGTHLGGPFCTVSGANSSANDLVGAAIR